MPHTPPEGTAPGRPPKPKPKPKPRPKPKPKPDPGIARRAAVVAYSHSLVGIREEPPHSNSGVAVRRLQASTGAFNAPWCVSAIQAEDLHVLGSTYANGTANAYFYASYAQARGHVIPHPVAGCAVVYHIGAGHAGRVVTVYANGTFDAVEGNEADAVRLVRRDPRYIGCTFVLRPEYR